MAPLLVLTLVFLIVLAARRDWRVAGRYGFAAMFLLTASAHFGSAREEMIRMVPPFFPRADLIVFVTGVLEIAGAIGLIVPRTSRAAAAALALLVVAMFPANVYAALNDLTLMGKPVTELPLRTAMQILWVSGLVALARPAAPVMLEQCAAPSCP